MPTYTFSGALYFADDNGFFPTDGVTSIAAPRLSGLAPAGATVSLEVAGASYSTVANASGQWLLMLASNTPDGAYTPTATVQLGGAVIGTFNVRPFTLDRTAPVQIENAHLVVDGTEGFDPGSSAVVTTNTLPVFSGRVAPGTLVALGIFGADVSGQMVMRQYSVTAGSEAWTIAVPDTEELPDGSYEVTYSFLDQAGNILTEIGTPLIVDNMAPGESVANLIEGAGQDTGSDAHDGITNRTSLTFVGTTEPYLTVVVEVDTQTQTVQADEQGRWEAAFTNLPDGEHVPVVTVIDHVGNTGDATDGQAVVVDTEAPANLADGLTDDEDNDTGAASDDRITANRTPELVGETEPFSLVSIRINDLTYTTTADDSGAWALTIADALPDGTYVPELSITDPAGNQSVFNGHEFTVDGTAPDGDGVSAFMSTGTDNDSGVSSADSITNVSGPLLSGTAPANATMVLEVDGTEYEVTVDALGQWQVQLDDLSDGSYLPTLRLIDVAGNVSEPFAGQAFTIDTTAPEDLAAEFAPEDRTGTSEDFLATSHTRPTLIGTTEAFATVELEIGGRLAQTQADALGHWQVTLTEDLADGEYVARLASTDVAGNRSDWVELDPVLIDTIISVANGGLTHDADSDSGSSETDNLTNNVLPVLSGHAEVGAAVKIMIAGQLYETTVDDDGFWEVSLESELSDGTYVAQGQVTDLAGNVGHFDLDAFTIDTMADLPMGVLGSHVAGKVGTAIDIDAAAMVGMSGLALVEDYGGGLARGLSIDSATGHIVGRATKAGSTLISVTTADAAGNEGTAYFQLNVFNAEFSGNRSIRTTDSEQAVKVSGTESVNRVSFYASEGDLVSTAGGDDQIKIVKSEGLNFGLIDGGAGLDKLTFGVSGETIDFSDYNNPDGSGQVVENVEWFEFSGKDMDIHITADDLFRLSSDKFDVDGLHRVVRMTTSANNSNTVDLEGFTQVGAANAFNGDGSLATKRSGDKFSKFVATVHDATGDHMVELLLERGFLT
jgi:Bacterial Ig-like domain/Putative Ig domain